MRFWEKEIKENIEKCIQEMTYILGANCNDGVVLVADRKVTFNENRSDVDFRKKLFGYPSHTVVGLGGRFGYTKLALGSWFLAPLSEPPDAFQYSK